MRLPDRPFAAAPPVSEETARRSAVRQRALRRLPLAAALPVAVLWGFGLLQGWGRGRGWAFGGPGVGFAMGATGVPLLASLTELVTGIQLRELSARWDTLAGWQRGVLGTGAAVLALVLFGLIALTVAVRLSP